MGAVVLDSSVFKIPWKSGLATEDPEITEEKICQRSSQSVPDDLRTDGLMTLTSRGYATPVAPKRATGATQRGLRRRARQLVRLSAVERER